MSVLLEVAEVAVAAALIPLAIGAHEATHVLVAWAFGVPAQLKAVFPRPLVSISTEGVSEIPFRLVCLAPTLAAVGLVLTLDTVGVSVAPALAQTALGAYVALVSPSLETAPDLLVAMAGIMYGFPSVYDVAPRTVARWKRRKQNAA
jgi:hypothetical protein